jgi:class 3 adenylate cyclase
MEGAGEVKKVNISEATYDLVKENPAFDFSARDKVEVKGKGNMTMYFVSKRARNKLS